MSAEDYHDVPGFGGGASFYRPQPRQYTCNFCHEPINFSNRKPINKDGSPHRCKARVPGDKSQAAQSEQPQATLFAMAAMNAIINAQIQAGGVDFIHAMNFYDIADASWRVAAAMVSKEKAFADECKWSPE